MSRTLVVGFDGAPLELCERFMAEGRMPALSSLIAGGSYGPMRSVFPYNSAVAWATLSTGANPGRHGIFDFVLPRAHDYNLHVATREDRRVPALWNYATEAGARCAVVNIPMTFPAEDLGVGVMVAGMDAPSLDDRAVSGITLDHVRELSRDYRIISNAHRTASIGAWDAAAHELIDTLTARGLFVTELAKRSEFDLLMVNLEATDGAHHFFWQHHDPSHPRHDPSTRWRDVVARVYETTDAELGRLIDAYRPDTVFVVSDHGGGPTNDWVLFSNDWLAAEGFLATGSGRGSTLTRRAYGELRGRLPVSVRRRLRPLFGATIDRARGAATHGDVDWSRSKAWAQMQPAVRLNLAGREAQGVVTDAEAKAILDELAERAQAVLFPGDGRVVTETRLGSEIYTGDAPGGYDLALELAAGTHVRSRNTSSAAGFLHRLHDVGMYLPSGVHTPVGMVAAQGAGVEALGLVGETDIHQVAASVLAVMGVAAPSLDGEPFGFVTSHLRSTGQELDEVTVEGSDLDAEEEAEVLERLRGLGYVD